LHFKKEYGTKTAYNKTGNAMKILNMQNGNHFFFHTFLVLLLFLPPFQTWAGDAAACRKYVEMAGKLIKSNNHFPASDALRKAIELDKSEHPSLHMKLAVLYYSLGLIPDAIREGEKAVNLTPSSKWYKYDLAKFYLVNRQLDKAEQQFSALLSLEPGFTFGYYYLAEVYFHKQHYDLSWLSLTRARFLGFKGTLLAEKLDKLSRKPTEDLENATGDKLFRFIKLPTRAKAEKVLQTLKNGRLFEHVELQLKKEHTSDTAFGIMTLSELKKSIADALRENRPYSSPQIIKTGSDYRVMQRILAFDPSAWQAQLNNTAASRNNSNKAAVNSETDNPAEKYISKKKPVENLFSARLAAFYALENWKESWERQDLEAYFDAYSESFMPSDSAISRATWEKRRKRSLTRPEYIHIKLVDPVIEMRVPNEVTTTFKQVYESDRYNDTVIKELTFSREKNGWKIINERIIQTIRN
jgi:hypothetical protein